ncbi:MAG: UDP-glucose 4-epimerase GalE [Alphaproteobacteria bacterium]|nr:UDP-glucose 4-epimerase GalE [Alphaproteobacteria bacterium]
MNPSHILVSGGAGYIGSHAAYALKQAGYEPVVVDNLSTGNAWAASFGAFEQGDIGHCDFVRAVCEKYAPVAAMHFAAFIEVGESVRNPDKYFENNRDKASRFFKTLNGCGVKKVVFSSTAAVYGDTSAVYRSAGGNGPVSELYPTRPINPYGQAKLEAEAYLRMLDSDGLRSIALRYFNVAGAADIEAQIGEAHIPESHLIPRLVLPLIDTPVVLLNALGLQDGFTIYGDDYPTQDGTAIRDYVHVLDLIDAHLRALDYLLNGGETDIFNLGSGAGFSVLEMVAAARKALDRPDFSPAVAPRREGDPAILVASNRKANRILGWRPARGLQDMIRDAAVWHRSALYRDAMLARMGVEAA